MKKGFLSLPMLAFILYITVIVLFFVSIIPTK
jgi:hypothetical protein